MLVSVISPLADEYENYDKGKAILASAAEGGQVLIRLGNDESLGRELRATSLMSTWKRWKTFARLRDHAASAFGWWCTVPALRAVGIDPTVTLRNE